MAHLTICDETFGGTGSGRRVAHEWEIAFAEISAADLIRLRVEREHESREPRPVVTPADLNDYITHAPRPALDLAIAEAQRGLETNAYFLIVNGRQIRELAETIALDDVNSATFLKLIPLKGG